MMFYRRFLFVLTIGVLIATSCTKPVLIGSDFLEEDKSDLSFKDDFELTFYTEKTDSVLVHSRDVSLQLYTYLVGNVDDPIFGSYSAELFAQPILPTVGTELIGSTLDSVVLQLRYDTLGIYGSISDPVTIEVYRMEENPSFNTKYYSNERFMSGGTLLGANTFIPRPFDSVTIFSPKDTFKIAPAIRIPLSTIILNELLVQDSSVFTNQDSFLNYFKGLNIRMTGANNTMLGFNLLNATSALSFYYDKDPAMDREFRLLFTSGSIKTVYMEHDYAGSFIEPSLTPEPEMDYWFVQGMSGVTTKMTIHDLSALGKVIINQAELEVFCSFPSGDVAAHYPPIRNLVTQMMTDTNLANSLDVNVALARASGNHMSPAYNLYYGGNLEKVTDGPPAVYRYKMKVTNQVKDIYLGKEENIIYFNPFEKPNVPRRSVMFGPSHPTYAPRLRIYYTAL